MHSSSERPTQEFLQRVIGGDDSARKALTEIATPMISFQTDKFCRRFCQKRYLNEQCTLSPPVGGRNSDRPLCGEANASYAWMLEDLTHENRIKNITAESEGQLAGYFKTIINSMPFYERWKNWRFRRRVHVPTYITELSPYANKVFYALQSGSNINEIAQNLGLDINLAAQLIDQIIIELTQRKRLHLLQHTRTHTFSELATMDDDEETANYDIEHDDFAPERLLAQHQVKRAWAKLDDVEQFVIEALVIEQQDANHVLMALSQESISLKEGQAAEDNNRQQLYYFKRKALEKLNSLLT